MLAHLQAFETLLIFSVLAPGLPQTRRAVPDSRRGDRCKNAPHRSRCLRDTAGAVRPLARLLEVALGGSQAWETPQCIEMLALLCRHGLALNMIVECEAPTGSQQGAPAL
jgi:hypothetical protein